jgi:hypothetical protein
MSDTIPFVAFFTSRKIFFMGVFARVIPFLILFTRRAHNLKTFPAALFNTARVIGISVLWAVSIAARVKTTEGKTAGYKGLSGHGFTLGEYLWI